MFVLKKCKCVDVVYNYLEKFGVFQVFINVAQLFVTNFITIFSRCVTRKMLRSCYWIDVCEILLSDCQEHLKCVNTGDEIYANGPETTDIKQH